VLIEKYPVAVKHRNEYNNLPLHIECNHQCRSSIILKYLELYPEALDDKAVFTIISRIEKNNLFTYFHVLLIVFTARPMSLYDRDTYQVLVDDIRDDPYCRRRILNLLPRHVLTQTHKSDNRDLNWRPRAAMMMLLSQTKIQQQ
jgi:hypothetical protein